MILRKFGLQFQLIRQLIAVAFQDRPNLLQADQARVIGDPAGGLKPLRRIGPGQIEQTQTDSIGLLGMALGGQL